jgi:hypothetical protein
MGLSSDDDTFVWASYNSGGPVQPLDQWQLSVDDLQINPSIYSLAYQIESGTGGVIPEPATWAMMIIGFGLVGASVRRRAAPAAA